MSLFGTQDAYRHNGDHDLMTSLGLRTSGFDRDWTDLGTVTLDSQREERPNATIKVEVASMPAQFFRFTITRPNGDNYKNGYMPLEVFEITTGSGSFSEYYPVALLVAGNMLNVKEIRGKAAFSAPVGYDPNEKNYEVRSLGREVTNFRAPSQARAIELLLELSRETEYTGTELSMYEGEDERAFIYVQDGAVAYQVAS